MLYRGEEAALRIEQQRQVAVRWRQVLDVVREDGIEIPNAIGSGERKMAAIILVDQRDGFLREPIFALPIAEIAGQSAAEPCAHFCAGLLVQSRERRLNYSCGFRGLHICCDSHLYSVAKACLQLGKRAERRARLATQPACRSLHSRLRS